MSQVDDRPAARPGAGVLELTVQAAGRCTVIALEGELCLVSEGVLDHCLGVVVETGCRHVVLDLSGLSFVDARGLSCLVKAARAMKRRGGSLELRSPQPWPYHVLDVAGLAGMVDAGN